MEEEFRRAYRDLNRRMKTLAESDGDVYVPSPEPTAPVDYILICMEPSLGGAQSKERARERIVSGARNFLGDIEPMLLHFSVRRFLCEKGQRYYITDFSKGAMPVKHAGAVRADRYDRWYPLLEEEIDLIAAPGARVIAVGKVVADNLRRLKFPRELTPVIHYSPLATLKRTALLKGHEDEFREFASRITLEDVLATAREVLDESGVPPQIYKEVLISIARSQLSESRRKLIYCYKLDFEAIRRRTVTASN